MPIYLEQKVDCAIAISLLSALRDKLDAAKIDCDESRTFNNEVTLVLDKAWILIYIQSDKIKCYVLEYEPSDHPSDGRNTGDDKPFYISLADPDYVDSLFDQISEFI